MMKPNLSFNWNTFIVIFILNVLSDSIGAQGVNTALDKNADAIILSEHNNVVFNSFDKYNQTFYRKVKVLNKKAENLQSVYLHYKKGSDKIKDVKITVYDGEGKKIQTIKEKELEDYASSDGFSMVTDYRVLHWKYNSSNYPFIIEYSYTKESNTTLSLPAWSPIPSHNIAVLESTYTLETSQNVRTKEMNLTDYKSITIVGNTYKMKQQGALNSEKYSEPDIKVFPAVIFNPKEYSFEGISGNFDTWKGYGTWIFESFLKEKKLENPDELKQELSKIITDGDSKLQVARKIYNYIQENTRYVSIALDEGGLNPMAPSKVHEVKYGDCKALSLYMHTLLDLFDIQSNYVEVHADSENPINLIEDFPSSYPGNHIILQLLFDGDTSWVDCTSSKNPFGYLGTFTDNRYALCINSSGGFLTKTPSLNGEQNLNTEKVEMFIDSNGKGEAQILHTSHGYSISSDLYLRDLSTKDQEDYLKDDKYKNIQVTKVSEFKVNVDENIPLTETSYKIEISKYTENAGDYVFISNEVSPINIPKLPTDGNRENNIYFPRAYSEQSEIRITLNVDYKLEEVEPVLIENEYGRYTKVIENTNEGLVVKRSFILNNNTYAKVDYNKIKSFFDSCIKSDRELTTIKKL